MEPANHLVFAEQIAAIILGRNISYIVSNAVGDDDLNALGLDALHDAMDG